MARSALAARRGFLRAQCELAYAEAVRRCLLERSVSGLHPADLPWLGVHGLSASTPASDLLAGWLASSDDVQQLVQSFATAGGCSLASILSQSPHAGAYATWSRPQTSSAS